VTDHKLTDEEEAALGEYYAAHRPTYAEISVRINAALYATEGEWAGIPMPLPGAGLVVESRHPRAEQLRQLQAIVDDDEPATPRELPDGCTLINEWHCGAHHRTVILYRDAEGSRTQWALEYDVRARNQFLWGAFETIDAWDLDRELRAMTLLQTLISPKMFKAYLLTGMFLETSRRSGVHYWFRRLRPTLALAGRGEVRILAALCLHPVAYYTHTFCGAMVPTDDVIAHLLLMRADEHLYWRRSQQHHPMAPEAGV
jgi:hypothetical protein